MSVAHQATQSDETHVLGEAFLNLTKPLGLTQSQLGQVIGKNRSSIVRNGISPQSKEGELALMLIRIYRSLHAMVGGDAELMNHWMHTENSHTLGIPSEQIMSVSGLNRVMEYLDAIRGKV